MRDTINGLFGRVRLGYDDGNKQPWKQNTVLYSWGSIVGPLLGTAESKYRISGMYLEFENLANPADVVSLPTYGREKANSYYANLASDPDRDFLRVPVSSALMSSTDGDLYPDNNAVSFFALSVGTEGVHGKAFSDANNSKVFGLALVAMLDAEDYTQDRVLCRTYLSGSSQLIKLASKQIVADWELQLL